MLRGNSVVDSILELADHLRVMIEPDDEVMHGVSRRDLQTAGCTKCGKCCRRFTAPAPKEHYLEYLNTQYPHLIKAQREENEELAEMMVWLEPIEGKWPQWWVTCKHYDYKGNQCGIYGNGRTSTCRVFNCGGLQPFGEVGPFRGRSEYVGSIDTPHGLDVHQVHPTALLAIADLLPFRALILGDPNASLTRLECYEGKFEDRPVWAIKVGGVYYMWSERRPTPRRLVKTIDEEFETDFVGKMEEG